MKYKPYRHLTTRQKVAVWTLFFALTVLAQKLMGVEVRLDFTLILLGLLIIGIGVTYGDKL